MVEPSEEQRELNDDAVRALTEGDYAKAITLLEEALYLGELNVTYLNLGRAYQLLGRCEQAREAFDKALEAPRAEQPPPGLVENKTREYMRELDQGCKPAEQAPAAPLGASVEEPRDASEDATASPIRSRTGAVASTVAAGVLLAGAGTLHLVARSRRATVTDAETNDAGHVTSVTERRAHRIESATDALDTVALSSAVAGTALGLVSGYLWVRRGASDVPIGVAFGPGGVSVTWRLSF